MSKVLNSIFVSTLVLLFCKTSVAQLSPDGISYQAVVRDAFGNELVNQTVTVEFAIRSGVPDGNIVYEEIHNLIPTNQFGLFTAIIGGGVETGNGIYSSLNLIPWENQTYFLEVRAIIPGQGNPQLIGVSQLLSVPYALFASEAASVLYESDGDTQNELIDDFSLSGSVLTITENNLDYSVDLSSLPLSSGDPSSENELISTVAISSSHQLTIEEGANDFEVDMSGLAYATWNESTSAVYNTTQKVGVGTSNPTSTLQVNGSLAVGVATINGGDYDMNASSANADVSVLICDVTTDDVIIHLVPAASCPGRMYKFRKWFDGITTSNDVLIVGASGELVDGSDLYELSSINAEYATIISNGTAWFIIDHYHE